MLFKEYDSAAHIASEKDISYEEGRLAEQENTKREKERADQLQSEISGLCAQINNLKHALILSYHTQGKADTEIAALCQESLDYIQDTIKKYQ